MPVRTHRYSPGRHLEVDTSSLKLLSRQVAMLRSYVTMIAIIVVACGAPLGAFLTSWVGWRW